MARKKADTYKETKVFEYPGMTITVHFPDLTNEERQKRFKQLHDAAADIIKAAIDAQ